MYNSSYTASKIKSYCKKKGITIKSMLSGCGLNKDTLTSMSCRGSWIKPSALAKIADYLDCSVDYLLGRTNDPQSHKHGQPAVLVDNQPRFLIRRAGRDGSFVEEYVTKSELERLQSLPDADDI